MSDDNPYRPPQAMVADYTAPAGARQLLDEPRKLKSGYGWDWIAAGWRLFMLNPGIWVVNCLVYFVIMIVASIMPFVSSILTTLFSPVFTGGLSLGCRELDEGGELRVDHLFAGFRQQLGNLIGVGGFYLIGMMVVGLAVGIVVVATIGLPALFNPESGAAGAHPATVILGAALALIVGLLTIAPLLMAYWFAPLLVMLNEVAPFAAMRMSFRACLRNMWPLTVYGLLMFVFAIVASLPLMLGLLVFIPVVWASTYAAYKDIFIASEATA